MPFANALREVNEDLDAREFRFVEEYCANPQNVDNALKAALAAGYARTTAETWAGGWALSPEAGGTKPHVYKAIQRRRQELRAGAIMKPLDVIAEIAKIAGFNPASYLVPDAHGNLYHDFSRLTWDQMAAITEYSAEITVEDAKDEEGNDVGVVVRKSKVKTGSKLQALDLLTKIFGMQKTIHSNDPDNPMPGMSIGVSYDLTKLSEEEAIQLKYLLEKARPD